MNTVKHAFLTSLLIFIFVAVGLTQQPKPARNTTTSDASRNSFSTHHPVSTQNVEAQRLFDQGLELIYALDYSGAANTFRRAAALDPNMAMAYWGIAYATGSDYYYSTRRGPGA